MALDTINRFGAFRLSRERQLPKPEWWIDRFLIKGSVTMLTAQPKVGKSAFSAKLAHAVATGGEFFERAVPQGEILYLAGERAAQTEDRLRELFEDDPTYMENVTILDTEDERFPHKFRFNDDPTAHAANVSFIENELGMRPSLIIIDTLTSFFEGDVTKPEHMKPFFDGVRRLCRRFNGQAIILHHDTKEYVDRKGMRTGGNSFNGSQQALARADSWVRAIVRKQIPDPDDPYGQSELKLVDFELQDDNFGGGFHYCVAVRKQLEDATPFLNVVNQQRENQKRIALEVLRTEGPMPESRWRTTCQEVDGFGTIGVQTFKDAIITPFLRDEQVIEKPNPKRSDWSLFEIVE